jgi:predicted amidohydrolase
MIKIGCLQPEIYDVKSECYEEIEALFESFMSENESCDVICLPERWVPLTKDIAEVIQQERGEDYQFICNLAKKYKTSIISGAIWEKRLDQIKPKITSYFIGNDGKEIGRQDKLHLYAYEREYFEPGNEIIIFSNASVSFAILICFDMAFVETPRIAVENGAQILFSPTQIREEGMANWEIYLKARALENRVPVAACNTLGRFFKRKFTGKSKIISFEEKYISPSKLNVLEAPENYHGYICAQIDLSFSDKIRKLRFDEILEKRKIDVSIIPF